jgi:alpha-amylase/alpha-mannosidase (GH57 family)
VELVIGTWPIEPGQSVSVTWECAHSDGAHDGGQSLATWRWNAGVNSYWNTSIGPFREGDKVTYMAHGTSAGGSTRTSAFGFRARPALYLALLWHHHQPLYRDATARHATGSYLHPWVRLHALRDYYSMAAIAAEHNVHVSFNLTPVLLQQIDDYLDAGATDLALELTKRPAERLGPDALEQLLSTFFDADWHRQIYPHPRYRELFQHRATRQPYSTQDVRDLQMWFNLAWFGQEFRTGDVTLVTRETVSVQRFVDQQRGFSHADIEAMLAEQYKILRAIVPLHRELQDAGRIEVSTTPAFHPILPLLIDTDRAHVDRLGAELPPRFARPDDAQAQVAIAAADYCARFGRPPAGMWPAEGAVSGETARLLSKHGLRWIATDRGVLARSGRFGYDVSNPNVLCQPYRFDDDGIELAMFFRDTALSDAIGFRYQGFEDSRAAAADFIRAIESTFLDRVGDSEEEDRVLTIVLDGENAWGGYPDDGRPFLHALYDQIAADPRLRTVTFAEYLAGDAERAIPAHPIEELRQIHDLATGSWIDEPGSAPGVDLGTWIGEPEENVAWSLLASAREAVASAARTPGRPVDVALQSLYAAEGSDWFWWFGGDQESRNDADFDELFRRHLRQSYRAVGAVPPAVLDEHIVPHHVLWTFTRPVRRISFRDRFTVRTNCPGRLFYQVGGEVEQSITLESIGGVMAGARRFQATLGPFSPHAKDVTFRFHCEDPACKHDTECCLGREQRVIVVETSGAPPSDVREPGATAAGIPGMR